MSSSWSLCSFPVWNSLFPTHSLKSHYIELDSDTLSFLKQKHFVVPSSVVPKFSGVEWDEFEEQNRAKFPKESNENINFPDTSEAIKAIFSEFGSVFVKTNWSSPKDAVWISSDGTIRCTSYNDALLLLCASSFSAHDLELSEKLGTKPILVFKKYYNLKQQREFRCFVVNKQLKAISQRHNISQPNNIDALTARIIEFHSTVLLNSDFSLDDYIFDVYLSPKNKVLLVDMQPLEPTSGTLLFTYRELIEHTEQSLPLIRCANDEKSVFVGVNNLWRLPYDAICGEKAFMESMKTAEQSNYSTTTNVLVEYLKREYEKQLKEDEDEDEDEEKGEEKGESEKE